MTVKIDAQKKAEILQAEFKSQGLSLVQGDALNLVAKLEGYSSWSAMGLARKKRVVAEDVAHFDISAMADRGTDGKISNEILAAVLGHVSPSSTTTLCEWRATNGELYRLQLSGCVLYETTDWKGLVCEVGSSSGQADALNELLALYKRPDLSCHVYSEISCIHSPIFEWISEGGEPIAQGFKEIELNKLREVSKLRAYIEYHGL